MGREFETRLFAGDTPLQHDIIWKTRAPPYTTHLHTATSLIIKILNFVQVDSRYYLGKYFEIWGVHLKMLHRYMTATDLLNLNFPPRSNVFPWYWLLAKSYRIDHFANPATEWELHICQKSRSKTSSWNHHLTAFAVPHHKYVVALLMPTAAEDFSLDEKSRVMPPRHEIPPIPFQTLSAPSMVLRA